MRVDTLKFVHDGTDVFHAFADLDTHCFLDAHAECMAVLVCSQIIEPVGQCQSLRIGEAFVHLLDPTVYISAVGVELFDGFAFK